MGQSGLGMAYLYGRGVPVVRDFTASLSCTQLLDETIIGDFLSPELRAGSEILPEGGGAGLGGRAAAAGHHVLQ